MLGISLNLSLENGYKCSRLSKTLLKKGLEFALYRRNSIVAFDMSFVLLSIEIDYILEKQSCKKDALMFHSSGYVKMVFTLLIKVVALHIFTTIIIVRVSSLERAII